jgi:hypothetical protein
LLFRIIIFAYANVYLAFWVNKKPDRLIFFKLPGKWLAS